MASLDKNNLRAAAEALNVIVMEEGSSLSWWKHFGRRKALKKHVLGT